MEAEAGLEKLDGHIVQTKGDKIIRSLYEKWKEVQSSREHAMIGNIASYCKSQNFDHAVFLVGAAHICSLRDMIERSKDDFADSEWRFSV